MDLTSPDIHACLSDKTQHAPNCVKGAGSQDSCQIKSFDYSQVEFVKSVYKLNQLPQVEFPEIAFAGRSNVGKSSLINRLIKRKNLVKVSARPGKTQSLNYFLVDKMLYLVDLPGYGYAKVPKKMQNQWLHLITLYLETRQTLRGVVVIIDLRHALKLLDLELIEWLRSKNIPCLPVYTKIDKLSKNQQIRQAHLLDSSLKISQDNRVLFSAKTGYGRENLINTLKGALKN